MTEETRNVFNHADRGGAVTPCRSWPAGGLPRAQEGEAEAAVAVAAAAAV